MQSIGLGLGIGFPHGSFDVASGDPLTLLDPDQALLVDSVAHYTTAQWPGFEHLLADRKYTVGTLRTPRAGRCWLFDGTNDYGTITSAALADRTNPLTITAWVKTTSNTANQTILGCGDASLNNAYALTYGYTDNKLEFWHDGSAAVAASSNQSLAGSWHHVAVVRIGVSGNWTITFYVDGVAVGSATTSTNPNGTGTQAFSVGRWGSYASSLFFSGSMRDVRVYSVAKDATAIADIYNQASTPGTYDTTSLLGAWWCEEESGTTGYDWSGNGRNLTLTNITQATFHASDTGVTYSDANVRGYRLSGSVYIPATSSTLAADGNALTVTGKCPQPGYAPQKVATFDGTNDFATLGARIGSGTISSMSFSAWVYFASSSSNYAIAGEYQDTTNNGSWLISTDSGGKFAFRYSANGTTLGTVYSTGNYLVASWHHIAFTYESSTLKIYINGSLDSTHAVGSSFYNSAAHFAIGCYSPAGSSGFFWNGRCADARVYSSAKADSEVLAIKRGTLDTTNLLGQWPMCEGPGSGNTNTTIYDVSGNGKHLTITNATISSFWANASTYDSCIPNYPLKYGYTVNGSGVIVPALLSGASDAAGNAIGQAAGGWASGLQNINCLPYTNPLGVNIGLETSLDPTADRKTTSSSKRRRRNTSGRYDRFGARATAMSDSTSNTYFGD